MTKSKQDVELKIRKIVKRIGHEIKENTELAEHETGIDNAKKSTKFTLSKIKKAI
jgi:hypothetical protein